MKNYHEERARLLNAIKEAEAAQKRAYQQQIDALQAAFPVGSHWRCTHGGNFEVEILPDTIDWATQFNCRNVLAKNVKTGRVRRFWWKTLVEEL